MTLFYSVIIPVYNGERFLAETIQTILDQQYPALEIIMVDDGSTDNSAAIAESFGDPVRVIRLPKSNVSIARNTGFRASKGDIIVFFDADDWMSDGALAATAAYFEQHPEINFVGGYIQMIPMLGAPASAWHSPNLKRNMPAISIQLGATHFRRELVEKVGGFNEELAFAEDPDLYLRMDENGAKRAFLHRVLVRYRRHQQNLTQVSTPAQLFNHYQMVLRWASQRRGEYVDGEYFSLWTHDLVPLTENSPSITIVIAVATHELSQAVDALASIAAQKHPPDQLVIVLPEMTDAIRAAYAPLADRTQVIISDEQGAAAYNLGIAAATQDAISFLRPIDSWHADFLLRQCNFLRQHPECAYVICIPGTAFNTVAEVPADLYAYSILSTCMIRREVFANPAVSGFDPAYEYLFDQDWLTRAEDAAVPFRYLEAILALMSPVPPEQLKAHQIELLRIRRASLHRRTDQRKQPSS
jgi:GT2 family glycosyltransferase